MNEIDEVVAEMLREFKPILRAALTKVREAQHSAIMAAITSAASGEIKKPSGIRRRLPTRKNGSYSGIATAVRKAFDRKGRVAAGINAADVYDFVTDDLKKDDMTIQQIRSALKQLCAADEIELVERGRYRATSSLKEAA